MTTPRRAETLTSSEPRIGSHRPGANPLVILIPILLLAFGLRTWGLAAQNVWWDEGIGVWLARMPVLEGVRWTAGDVHPPLYYMLLRGWQQWAGESVFALRFLSVIFSFLTVPLVFRLGRVLGGKRTGMLAALLVTVSRFAIWWAQEIRMYAPAALLATGSLWAAVWCWHARHRRTWIPWLAYVGFTLGSLYTLYLTATVVAVTNAGALAVWLWERRRGKIASPPANRRRTRWLGRWIAAQVMVVALFLPWVLYALPQMHGWSSDTPFAPGFFLQLYTTMLAVGVPLDVGRYLPLVAVLFLGLTAGAGLLWRQVRGAAKVGGLVMAMLGLVLPPLVVVAVSLPGLRFYFSRPLVPRYLLPLAACYAVLVAWVVDSMATRAPHPAALQRCDKPSIKEQPWQVLGLALAGLASVAGLVGVVQVMPGRVGRDVLATIGEVLRTQRRPEDAVLLYVDRDWPIFAAAYAGPRHNLPYGANLSDPEEVAARLEPIWEAASGLWLVSTPESLQADPQQQVPAWLDSRAVMSETLVYGEVSLTFYARLPERAATWATVVPGYVPPTVLGTPFGLVGASVPLARYGTGDTVRLGLTWVPPLPESAEVVLEGPGITRTVGVPPVPGDLNVVRSQSDLPLTADLPGGKYRLSVRVPGFEPVTVGQFRLVQKAAATGVTPETIPHTVGARFGDTIELVGYALPRTEVAAGETLPLTLYWRTNAPLTTRYKVFTHLLGTTFNAETESFLWGQQDNEPGNGQMPTTVWAPGTVISDGYMIAVDPQAPPGPYTLEVGLYGLADGVRLPAAGSGVTIIENAVVLDTVEVSE